MTFKKMIPYLFLFTLSFTSYQETVHAGMIKKAKKKAKKMKKKITGVSKEVMKWTEDQIYNNFIQIFEKDEKKCSRYTPLVKNFWASEGKTDITFIAMGDTQFGGGSEDKNIKHIKAINSLEGRTLTINGENIKVKNIRGVIMAGDMTQNGRDGRCGERNELKEYIKTYGLCGERQLKYPIYEGWGNHDYYQWKNPCYKVHKNPAITAIRHRNKYRPEVIKKVKAGHYSWDWDNVHFVMVNLKPSDVDPLNKKRLYNPHHAFKFLEEDLKENVGDSKKGVIVIGHYGIGGWHEEWWKPEEAETFIKLMKNYNFLGYIHGHNHSTQFYSERGMRIYDVGSPYYKDYNIDKKGHFSFFRITNDKIMAIDIAWDPEDPTKMTYGAQWENVGRVAIPLN